MFCLHIWIYKDYFNLVRQTVGKCAHLGMPFGLEIYKRCFCISHSSSSFNCTGTKLKFQQHLNVSIILLVAFRTFSSLIFTRHYQRPEGADISCEYSLQTFFPNWSATLTQEIILLLLYIKLDQRLNKRSYSAVYRDLLGLTTYVYTYRVLSERFFAGKLAHFTSLLIFTNNNL